MSDEFHPLHTADLLPVAGAALRFSQLQGSRIVGGLTCPIRNRPIGRVRDASPGELLVGGIHTLGAADREFQPAFRCLNVAGGLFCHSGNCRR